MAYVVWILASLLLAAAVFLVANLMQQRDGEDRGVPDDGAGSVRSFARDFRGGLRRRRANDPKPVDTDLDDFFAATTEVAPAYVDADELTGVLHRAQVRVSTPFHGTPRTAPEQHQVPEHRPGA